MYFFETVDRIHRAGEGEPHTGLKSAGRDLGPAIPAADKAIEDVRWAAGEVGDRPIGGGYPRTLSKDTCYKNLLRKRNSARGPEHVKAFVELVHYAEEVYASVHEHSQKSASPDQHH